MRRKAELCLSTPCHVCGTGAKTECSGERRTCDVTTADGAQEQRNGNVWIPELFLSMSLGVLVVEGGQESDDCWVEHGRTACCCHPDSLSFTLHSLRDSEGTANSPELEVAPIESPDTAKRHEGRECWHGRGQQAEVKGSVAAPPHPHPCLEGLGVLLPSGSLFLHFCPCFRTAKSLAHRLLAARGATHEQFHLPLLTPRAFGGQF